MLSILATAVSCFVATNIDVFFILAMLLAQARDSSERAKVFLGQLLGIGCLVIVSCVGALGTRLIPQGLVGLLGIVPIALGVRYLACPDDAEGEAGESGPASVGVAGTMLLTVSNGGDNLGVYIPTFAGYTPLELVVTAIVFAAMTVLWCGMARSLGTRPWIRERVLRWKRYLVPAVLVAIGASVLVRAYVL